MPKGLKDVLFLGNESFPPFHENNEFVQNKCPSHRRECDLTQLPLPGTSEKSTVLGLDFIMQKEGWVKNRTETI